MSSDDGSTYRGPAIPRPLGEGLQLALDLDQRPRDFGEYVDEMATLVEREGLEVDLDTLCTTDESPHKATFGGETQHYHCTLDAVIVPFLAEDVGRVDVETVSPVSGDRITYTVAGSSIVAEPGEAVLSFGVGTDVERPPPDARSPALAYRRVCPYGKAFVSHGEYERWAEATEGHTMAMSLEDALALSEALADVA
ncbi:MAG: organomercurial lyase [Halobacteriales archaeon]